MAPILRPKLKKIDKKIDWLKLKFKYLEQYFKKLEAASIIKLAGLAKF